jgi:gluconolactonase
VIGTAVVRNHRGQYDIRHRAFSELIQPDARLERVATGFEFVEGPIWHVERRHLTFSDIVGDTQYRWSEAEGVTVLRRPSNMANGNAYDRQGRILTCEHATSRVARIDEDGSVEVLATHYGGKELNSPNDIVVRRDDSIYFTDPTSGRGPKYGVPRPQELDFQGVYRLDPTSKTLILLADDFDKPNGLCFSADEASLYVNDTNRAHIRVFAVLPDGTLANGRLWAELAGQGTGVADGMKIDAAGNLYCCGPGGIHVFDPSAHCLGVILMPEHTTNLCFGDDDLRSLYITAATSIYRLRVESPGFALW